MERQHLTFLFRVGQPVCWLQPGGPRYVIQARRYEEGEIPPGYTALPPSPVPQEPRQRYLLRNPHNILGDFWANEADLYRAEESV